MGLCRSAVVLKRPEFGVGGECDAAVIARPLQFVAAVGDRYIPETVPAVKTRGIVGHDRVLERSRATVVYAAAGAVHADIIGDSRVVHSSRALIAYGTALLAPIMREGGVVHRERATVHYAAVFEFRAVIAHRKLVQGELCTAGYLKHPHPIVAGKHIVAAHCDIRASAIYGKPIRVGYGGQL